MDRRSDVCIINARSMSVVVDLFNKGAVSSICRVLCAKYRLCVPFMFIFNQVSRQDTLYHWPCSVFVKNLCWKRIAVIVTKLFGEQSNCEFVCINFYSPFPEPRI
jgi:hypothetical protein